MSTPPAPSNAPASAPEAVPFASGLPAEHVFPTLTPAQVARMAAHGRRRAVAANEVVAEADRSPRVFVVTRGRLVAVQASGDRERVFRVLDPGQFTGEMSVLAGRRGLARPSAPSKREKSSRWTASSSWPSSRPTAS